MSLSTPFDILSQGFSSFNTMAISSIRGLDSFGKTTANTFSKGLPAPNVAINSLLSLPNAILPKSLSLPNLGAVAPPPAPDLARGLNLQFPSVNNIFPSMGMAPQDVAVFGEGKTDKGISNSAADSSAAANGVALF